MVRQFIKGNFSAIYLLETIEVSWSCYVYVTVILLMTSTRGLGYVFSHFIVQLNCYRRNIQT